MIIFQITHDFKVSISEFYIFIKFQLLWCWGLNTCCFWVVVGLLILLLEFFMYMVTWYFSLFQVTSLFLDNQHITKLSGLERLENLKYASFNKNDITKMEVIMTNLVLFGCNLWDTMVLSSTGSNQTYSFFLYKGFFSQLDQINIFFLYKGLWPLREATRTLLRK